MNTAKQWADRNRPEGDPDYMRLVDVTNRIESELRGEPDPKQVLGKRFDYDVAMKFGMRRTEETSQQVKLENPDAKALTDILSRAWPEGFVFGALSYSEEHRGRMAEALLDRIALANINQKLATGDTEAIFRRVASTGSLAFVSAARSLRAAEALAQLAPVADHQAVKALVASHWMDGFLVGLVFEELGGHRDR